MEGEARQPVLPAFWLCKILTNIKMSFATLEIDQNVAVIWLDQPDQKLNALSLGLLGEFTALLDQIEQDDQVQAAVLISRKPECFVAGADIREFLQFETAQEAEHASAQGKRLFDRMASCPKPFLAAINGACLGGGLELALACCYRIATSHPKTVLGLPEVKLGLLPGAGGTQRLPRLIGLQQALPIMLSGKNVYPYPARKRGLVDEVIHPHGLLQAAKAAARQLAAGKPPKKRKRPFMQRLLEGNPIGRRLIYRTARKRTLKQTWGNYPAPMRIIEVVATGMEKGIRPGNAAESKAFGELMQTPQSHQLIQLFFAMTSGKARGWLAGQERKVKEIGVLGAGLMGAGIAQVSALRGCSVRLKDLDQKALAQGEKSVWHDLQGRVKKRAMTAFERDQAMSRIHPVTGYEGFGRVQLVIEAVFEDLQLKRRILAQTEEATSSQAIFASNTSAIPIGQIAAQARRPEQVIGMHYFSPVPKMPLLEIIATEQTADWVVATAAQLGVRQGKTVIVVGDGPGFYTTRILSPLMNEALILLAEGASVEQLDQAMRRFGFPVGPVTLMDEVGIDVGAHVGRTLGSAFADRGVPPNPVMEQLAEAGYQGRKNRRGFYLYPQGKKRKKKRVNREIYSHFGGPHRKRFKEKEIQDRLSLIMVNEAAHCLQEKILQTPRDGDLGAVLGLGFPPFLGGPFRYIDSLGVKSVTGRLDELRDVHGLRFEAAEILREFARQGRLFYSE